MDARVSIVVSLIEMHFARDVRLNELCSVVNLSPCHLTHLFKATLGTSPTKYLKSIRMQHAQDLLDHSFLSVKEIGMRVGMSDTESFCSRLQEGLRTFTSAIPKNACTLPSSLNSLRKLGVTSRIDHPSNFLPITELANHQQAQPIHNRIGQLKLLARLKNGASVFAH